MEFFVKQPEECLINKAHRKNWERVPYMYKFITSSVWNFTWSCDSFLVKQVSGSAECVGKINLRYKKMSKKEEQEK